jgi:predicted Zn-dependent protease with MMP-like domain
VTAIRSVTVQSGENGATPAGPSGPPGLGGRGGSGGTGGAGGSGGSGGPRRRVRRRDRHGRGLRGRLVPPGVPLYRTRAQQFDDMVLDAVARLEPRWEAELAGVEFAVQEVPEADELAGDSSPLPLARAVPGSADPHNPGRAATPARIVVYRRPLMARAEDDDELSDLVFGVVVEEFASVLGLDPETIDPGYNEGFE